MLPMAATAVPTARAGQYQRLAELIEVGNRPLFELASCFSQVRVDPELSMLPGTEMFYRAMSEMIYSRYGLKGTVQRALMGEAPRTIHNSLVLCSMNVNRMAEQAGHLLALMRQGAGPDALPMVDRMSRLFAAERANFRNVMQWIQQIMGPDAPAAQQRVQQAMTATPVTTPMVAWRMDM